MRHIEYHRRSSGAGFSPQVLEDSADRHARHIDQTVCLLARARAIADPVQRRALTLAAEIKLDDPRRSAVNLSRVIRRIQRPYETR